MNDTPLIWTTRGNVPEASLRREVVWEDAPDYVKLTVCLFDGAELVRSDVYVMAKRPLAGELFGGTFAG